jgi:hypothetical protein
VTVPAVPMENKTEFANFFVLKHFFEKLSILTKIGQNQGDGSGSSHGNKG